MFTTRGACDSHVRGECVRVLSLTDLKGNIKHMERVNGKFTCPLCLVKYSWSDNLTRHWKECKMQDETESNCPDNF